MRGRCTETVLPHAIEESRMHRQHTQQTEERYAGKNRFTMWFDHTRKDIFCLICPVWHGSAHETQMLGMIFGYYLQILAKMITIINLYFGQSHHLATRFQSTCTN